MTKAVSSMEICFIKSVLLLREHGHGVICSPPHHIRVKIKPITVIYYQNFLRCAKWEKLRGTNKRLSSLSCFFMKVKTPSISFSRKDNILAIFSHLWFYPRLTACTCQWAMSLWLLVIRPTGHQTNMLYPCFIFSVYHIVGGPVSQVYRERNKYRVPI